MSITPPTPAEVAEARAWFEKRNRSGMTTPEDWIVVGAGTAGQRHAAVLVRAALAAPAETAQAQHDRDIDDTLFDLVRYWAENPGVRYVVAGRAKPLRDRLDALLEATDSRVPAAPAEQPREVGVLDVPGSAPLGAPASSSTPAPVSPSAVPAVSAGGAGRDLTAADVRDSYVLLLEAGVPTHEERQFVAEHLNAIARPADGDVSDTGTQATEQTTEYRAAVEGEQTGTYQDRLDKVREFVADRKARGQAYHIESRTVSTSVSPWAPVDVHDEEQQR